MLVLIKRSRSNSKACNLTNSLHILGKVSVQMTLTGHGDSWRIENRPRTSGEMSPSGGHQWCLGIAGPRPSKCPKGWQWTCTFVQPWGRKTIPSAHLKSTACWHHEHWPGKRMSCRDKMGTGPSRDLQTQLSPTEFFSLDASLQSSFIVTIALLSFPFCQQQLVCLKGVFSLAGNEMVIQTTHCIYWMSYQIQNQIIAIHLAWLSFKAKSWFW